MEEWEKGNRSKDVRCGVVDVVWLQLYFIQLD